MRRTSATYNITWNAFKFLTATNGLPWGTRRQFLRVYRLSFATGHFGFGVFCSGGAARAFLGCDPCDDSIISDIDGGSDGKLREKSRTAGYLPNPQLPSLSFTVRQEDRREPPESLAIAFAACRIGGRGLGLPWSAIAACAHVCPAHDETRTEALFVIFLCTIIHHDHV